MTVSLVYYMYLEISFRYTGMNTIFWDHKS